VIAMNVRVGALAPAYTYAAPVGGDGSRGAGVALVTGAGGGIGRAVARALLQAGRALALVDHDVDALDEIVDEVRIGGGPAALA
jgi:NAD(P)-dependent dehydrogenase (short-subunit alcohol dehydrogenase family)